VQDSVFRKSPQKMAVLHNVTDPVTYDSDDTNGKKLAMNSDGKKFLFGFYSALAYHREWKFKDLCLILQRLVQFVSARYMVSLALSLNSKHL